MFITIHLALKRFDHESCVKSAQCKLLKCLISRNFNRGVLLDKIFFKEGISVIDFGKGTIAMNNGTTV